MIERQPSLIGAVANHRGSRVMVGTEGGRTPDPAYDTDRLAYSMKRQDFERETVALLRRARAALLCVSFAIRLDEGRRDRDHGVVMPVISDAWEDEWKVWSFRDHLRAECAVTHRAILRRATR